jgi:hypothetical protein
MLRWPEPRENLGVHLARSTIRELKRPSPSNNEPQWAALVAVLVEVSSFFDNRDLPLLCSGLVGSTGACSA